MFSVLVLALLWKQVSGGDADIRVQNCTNRSIDLTRFLQEADGNEEILMNRFLIKGYFSRCRETGDKFDSQCFDRKKR